jgi:hypothetical protein
MSERTHIGHPIYWLLPTEVEGFDSLAELALDMRWSWNHASDECDGRLIPRCGSLRTTRGASCRRSRGTGSNIFWPIPLEDARILWQR